MVSATTRMSDDDLLIAGREILREVRRAVPVTTNDIISQVTDPILSITNRADFERCYLQFGSRFLTYLKCDIEAATMRAACVQACKEVRKPGELAASQELAMTRFGYGACGDLSYLTLNQAALRNIPVTSIEINRWRGVREFGHRFVVLGLSMPEISSFSESRNSEIMKIVNEIGRGVLIDPLLKVVCKLSEITTAGADFCRYINNFNYRYTVYYAGIPPKPTLAEFVKTMEPCTLRIYQRARELLDAKRIHPNPRQRLMMDLVKDKEVLIATQMIEQMRRIFPSFTIDWKKNTKDGIKVWGEGSQAQMEYVYAHLQAYLVNAVVPKQKVGSDLYVVSLKEPTLEQIRLIPPYNPATHAAVDAAFEGVLEYRNVVDQKKIISVMASYLS